VNDLTANKYQHTFVTVDRAEPHKNIVRTVNAFGELLKQNPELAQDVRFLLFLTRGPAHISAYKRLSEEIWRAARRVNDRFDGVQPVRVVEESTIYRAVAVLSIYDTLVHVPVIDGTVRSAMDGANLNSVAGGMIVSESSVAADLFGEFVIDESDDERRRKADATEAIASSNRVGQMSAQILTSQAIAMGSREHH
jgi:trehalose 6-phosphate synthase